MESAKLSTSFKSLKSNPRSADDWEVLVEMLMPFVRAAILTRIRSRDRHTIDDLSQTIFLKLFASGFLGFINNPDELRAYLWKMCLNEAIGYLRESRRRILGEISSDWTDLEVFLFDSKSEVAEDSLYRKQRLAFVEANLSESDRELLRLVLSGNSLAEAAEALGKRYSTVVTSFHRLRKRISKLPEDS